MNREEELITYLKEPIRGLEPKRWNKVVPFKTRFVYKSWGGRAKGRWLVFKDKELSPHKPFSDALIATLAAKSLLFPFAKDCERAFFLKEIIQADLIKQAYCYESFTLALAAYRRF